MARAHCWFDDLVSGRCRSMVEIAKCNGVGKQYVSRPIRLAFLAPEMVQRKSWQAVNLCLPKPLSGMTRGWAYGNEATDGRVSEPAAACFPSRFTRSSRGQTT